MNFNKPRSAESQTYTATLLSEYIDKLFRSNNVTVDFSDELDAIAEEDFGADQTHDRLDLRELPCMTIDCDDTKDMDDACSLEETPCGFRLGVHIADVSSYVTPNSALDMEAQNRGTSIYLPDRTVPMLPRILSDDLCSLNPGVDRRTISVLIDLDRRGNVTGYSIHKALIRSAIKGSYSEVNALLDGTAGYLVTKKYESVAPMLKQMALLAAILRLRRHQHGAHICDDAEPKATLANGTISIICPARGDAEKTVEEFMVLCNSLVGRYLEENGLPGIYRTQERLGELASYEDTAGRHESLGFEGYVHFTSPIRRLADLKVHQCLTMHLAGCSAAEIAALLGETVDEDSELAVRRSRRAKSIEHACFKYCCALYFAENPDETHTGRFVGWDRSGDAILRIDGLAVKVVAPHGYRARRGKRYSFNVRPSADMRRIRALDVRQLT